MAFHKLLGKSLFVVVHAAIELLFRNIHIIYLYVEILSGGEAVTLFFDFIVGDSY